MSKYVNMDKHFALLEQIKTEKDPEVKKKLCQQDISLYHAFCKEWVKEAEERIKGMMKTDKMIGEKHPAEYYKGMIEKQTKLPHYPSFKTLAIIYEKERNYTEAIKVCKAAIKAGAIDDGTNGGMTERLEKLEAKKG